LEVVSGLLRGRVRDRSESREGGVGSNGLRGKGEARLGDGLGDKLARSCKAGVALDLGRGLDESLGGVIGLRDLSKGLGCSKGGLLGSRAAEQTHQLGRRDRLLSCILSGSLSLGDLGLGLLDRLSDLLGNSCRSRSLGEEGVGSKRLGRSRSGSSVKKRGRSDEVSDRGRRGLLEARNVDEVGRSSLGLWLVMRLRHGHSRRGSLVRST